MKKDIRICGFGGQGVILAGFIIGKAASVFENYHAVQSQSYGPEARGGAARSEVIISDERIGYPLVRKCDILVAMGQDAFDLNIKDLKEEGIVLVDEDLVNPSNIKNRLHSLPATRVAEKELKSKIYTNVVMLGALTKITQVVNEKAMKKAIATTVRAETKDMNIQAFEIGLALRP